MPKPGKTGVTRIVNAFGYSMKGIVAAYKHEAAFRQEILLAIILIPASFFITNKSIELALMIGSIMLVLIVEIINSAIEAVVDRMGDDIHELAGRAKDMGSAAVLFALLNVAVIWGLILFEKYFS